MQAIGQSTGTATDRIPGVIVSEAPGTASLRSRAFRASAWVVGAKPLGITLQLARSLVLTRLLFPEAFGLMALVGVVMQGLQMCSDVGIGPSIIKSQRGDDPGFLRTAWTLQIIRGLGLWLVCCALAWPASVFYREPMLLALLPVAGLNIVVASFGTMAWSTHDRAMKRGRMTVIACAAESLNLIVMVFAAWWLRSVWALVIGQVSGNLITLVLGHTCLQGIRHRLCWDREAVHELIHFGKWVFLSSLLTFFAMQLDRLMLGKLIPLGLLGVYSISLVLANLPRELVQSVASLVLFPALAEKFRRDPDQMHMTFRSARSVMLRIGLLLCAGVVAVAPAFFYYFYDPRYAAAGWIAQLLALSAWTTTLNVSTGYALLALGDSKSLVMGNMGNILVTVAAGLSGFHLFGLGGFIAGYAMGTAVGEIVQALRIRRYHLRVLSQDAAYTVVGLLAGGLYLGATACLEVRAKEPSPQALTLCGLAVWFLLASCLLPEVKRQLFPTLRLPGLRRWPSAGSTI